MQMRSELFKWSKGQPIPYGTMLSDKRWGKKIEEETLGMTVAVFPGNCCMWQGPAFLDLAEHLPAHRKRWINYLFCLACVHSFFLYLLNCFYFNKQVFPLLSNLFSLPSHRGAWTIVPVGFSYLVGLITG